MIVDSDLLTLAQASEVATSSGKPLTPQQLRQLCREGKLVGQKVGSIWLVSRKSVEGYVPGKKGFAAYWERKKKQSGENILKQALAEAARGEAPSVKTDEKND